MLDGHGALLLWLSDGPGALDAIYDSLNPPAHEVSCYTTGPRDRYKRPYWTKDPSDSAVYYQSRIGAT